MSETRKKFVVCNKECHGRMIFYHDLNRTIYENENVIRSSAINPFLKENLKLSRVYTRLVLPSLTPAKAT